MKLFEPLQINSMQLANRIVLTAMVTRLSGEDGFSAVRSGEPCCLLLDSFSVANSEYRSKPPANAPKRPPIIAPVITPAEVPTAGTIRLKLLKVAARVTVSVRRVYVQLSSSYAWPGVFRLCQARLMELVPAED